MATRSKGIHQLPAEVSHMIFKHTVNISAYDNPSVYEHDVLVTLSLVCKTWEQLISTSPTLWTVVECALPRKIQQIVLSHSAALPLTVDARWTAGLPASLDTIEDFPALHRIQALRLLVAENGGDLESLNKAGLTLCNMAPALKTFILDGRILTKSISPKWFGGVPPPRLQTVTLRYCEINLASPWMANVTQLSLRNVIRPSLADLLPALQRMSNLKELWLDHSLPWTTTPNRAPQRMILPSLTNIHIIDHKLSRCDQFLNEIETPALEYIMVDCEFVLEGECGGIFRQIARLHRRYNGKMAPEAVDYLDVQVIVSESTIIKISGYDQPEEPRRIFSVTVAGFQDGVREGDAGYRTNGEQERIVVSALSQMRKILRSVRVLGFSGSSTSAYTMRRCWWTIFADMFPKLLVLFAGDGHLGRLIMALYNDHDRDNDDDGRSQWMFPRLWRVEGNGQSLEPQERTALDRVLETRASQKRPLEFIDTSLPGN